MPTKSNRQLMAFVVGKLLAENLGLSSSQATQWAVILMSLGLSSKSLFMVWLFAQHDMETIPPDLLPNIQNSTIALRQTVDDIQKTATQANTNTIEAKQQIDTLMNSLRNADAKIEEIRQKLDLLQPGNGGTPQGNHEKQKRASAKN